MSRSPSLRGKSPGQSEMRKDSFHLPPLPVSPRYDPLGEINSYLLHEMEQLHCPTDRLAANLYVIYRHAFDMLIDSTASYKRILTAIKLEYENCIEALVQGDTQAHFLQGMLTSVVVGASTLRNYQRRSDDLHQKIRTIKTDNERLREEIRKLQEERKSEENALKSAEELSEKQEQLQKQPVWLAGMSLTELTDINALHVKLAELQETATTMERDSDTKFTKKERKGELRKHLMGKERACEHLVKHSLNIKERYDRLKVAVETIKSALPDENKTRHLDELVLKALNNYGVTTYGNKTDYMHHFVSFDEDDPLKKKEAERLIEYIDYFNELFDFGYYNRAAMHAANSPKGLLRTYEAMVRFRNIEPTSGECPLLLFCQALMTTASAYPPLSAAMSTECIRCALKEKRLDLASSWLAQGYLTPSITMGDVFNENCCCADICTCTCQALAQLIYVHAGAHRKAAVVMCKQGKYHTFMQFAKEHAMFDKEDIKFILSSCPHVDLTVLMLSSGLISFSSLIGTLLTQDQNHTIIPKLLQYISDNGVPNKSKTPVTMRDLLAEETQADGMSEEKWMQVVALCQENGMLNLGVELLSALVIREAMSHAEIACSMDYIS